MNKRARELQEDPLSAASAGLVALGIDRARRVDTLDVLAFLLDHADASGEVVLDRNLFAREEALGVDKCLDAYVLLENLEVVLRTDRGWKIPDFALHNGPRGETAASLAVLRKHLASVGSDAEELEPAGAVGERVPVAAMVSQPVAPIRRLRRAVPIAAGLAASAAAFAGLNQFVPQAAVTGRNASQGTDVPTSVARGVATTAGKAQAAVAGSTSTALGSATTTLATATTGASTPSVACVVPKVVAVVSSVEVVRLALGGNTGVWAAVVKGTATLTDADKPLLLPALDVVAHVAGGDTDAVRATLATPLLQPNKAAPFNAIVALGSLKPTETVTASATAAGMPTC